MSQIFSFVGVVTDRAGNVITLKPSNSSMVGVNDRTGSTQSHNNNFLDFLQDMPVYDLHELDAHHARALLQNAAASAAGPSIDVNTSGFFLTEPGSIGSGDAHKTEENSRENPAVDDANGHGKVGCACMGVCMYVCMYLCVFYACACDFLKIAIGG
jgi:hypothetical protein